MNKSEIANTYRNMNRSDLIRLASANKVKYRMCSKAMIVKNMIGNNLLEWDNKWMELTDKELKKPRSINTKVTETNDIPTFKCDHEGFDETLKIKTILGCCRLG